MAEGNAAMRRLTRTAHFKDPNLEQQIERMRWEAAQEMELENHAKSTGGTHGIPKGQRFESTAGAQQKANQALLDAKSYTDEEVGSSLVSAKQYTDEQAQPRAGGPTSGRPAQPRNYEMYFDTDLGHPVWWNGNDWVDASGTVV